MKIVAGSGNYFVCCFAHLSLYRCWRLWQRNDASMVDGDGRSEHNENTLTNGEEMQLAMQEDAPPVDQTGALQIMAMLPNDRESAIALLDYCRELLIEFHSDPDA
jgi:hypothetical protein